MRLLFATMLETGVAMERVSSCQVPFGGPDDVYMDNERFRGDLGNVSMKARMRSTTSFPQSCNKKPCSELLGVNVPGVSLVS